MTEAERVAALLAYEFLREGKFTASHGPVEVDYLAPLAVAAVADSGEPSKGHAAVYGENLGFGGIAVQSVGFEEGPESPKVHVYLTRGTSRLMKSLPSEIEGVSIRVHRMGLITVRPDAAASATNQGHLFERNGRIACGSSCAPTSENCSGTLGALVRRPGSQQMYCFLTITFLLGAIMFREINLYYLQAALMGDQRSARREKSDATI